MAELAGPYIERADLKARMQIPDSDTTRDAELDDARMSASDDVNRFCGRVFGRAEVASARTFYAGRSGVDVDDFWDSSTLLINGVPWALGQAYALEPLNGVLDGTPGWPTTRLATPWMTHPIYWGIGRAGVAVEVTAKWGWAEVPAAIKDATFLLAADNMKSGDAPFGVAGFGDYVTRVRYNGRAMEKLKPYVREPLKAA
jgi:hypothetical protein